MPQNFVLTVTGPDRIGIVQHVTSLVFDRGGNVETSRMARLGGEFAILMLASLPDDRLEALATDLEGLAAQGYKVTTSTTDLASATAHADWMPYQIEVEGADNEGIIREVAQYLADRAINIESVDSDTIPAPVTGSPLFTMRARIVAPPTLSGQGWEAGLNEIADRMNLEIRVSEVPLHDQQERRRVV